MRVVQPPFGDRRTGDRGVDRVIDGRMQFGSIGVRGSFADIGATLAEHLGIEPGPHGTSFLATLKAGG